MLFPMDIEHQIENAYKSGHKSLFLQAMEMSDGERQEIRDWKATFRCRHALFAVFLYDFWKNSDGKVFWCYRKPYPQPNEREQHDPIKIKEFDEDWNGIYCTDKRGFITEDDNGRLAKIKSKCWVLAGDVQGKGSEVWGCLRDAIHSFKKNDGEIVVSKDKNEERAFIRLLLQNDTIERREYARLVEYLATGTSSKDLDKPWRTLIEKCEERLGREADVDWYLELEGSEGSFGVGFDNFPSNNIGSAWRKFKINGEGKEIDSDDKWFEPIKWDETVEVKYGNLSDPDNKTPLLFKDRQYEIFIHYIEDKHDWRRHWWRWDAQPTMASAEKEFLVCAMDRTDLEQLANRSESDSVQWESVEDANFQVELRNNSNRRVYYRKFKITDRPSDKDLDITVGGISITVMGKKPIGKAICNEKGIRLDKDTRNLVAFPSEAIELSVENARSNVEYSWTISVGEAMSIHRTGAKAQLILSKEQGFSEKNCITTLSIECMENGTRLSGIIGGIILPDAFKGYLLDKTHGGNMLPANWNASPISPIDAISAYIDGLEKLIIKDPNHRMETVCIPQTSFAWWFEIGNYHYRDLPEEARLFSYGDKDIPTFTLKYLGKTYLCIVPNGDGESLPEGFTQTTKGYKRCKLSDLIGTSKSITSREFITKEYRLPNGLGPVLFNYQWPKAYNWPIPSSEFLWASQGRKASLSEQSLKDLPNCILRASGIDNHVGCNWVSYNSFIEDELKSPPTPAQMLATLQGSLISTPYLIVIQRILEILAQKENRRFRGSCYGKPTDREWLLCLAALKILLNDGAKLSPDSEKVVSAIFRCLPEDKAKSVLLARYLNLCEEVSRLPQFKANR